MRFFFEILLQSQKDLDKIMVISEEYDFDIEVLNRADGKAYLIKFESKYQEYEFFNSLEDLFEFDYIKVDKIKLGQYDVRITVSRVQDMYEYDNWGRPYETNDSAEWYFIKPKDINTTFPTKKVSYSSNGKRRWVWLGVLTEHMPNTNKQGYFAVATEENSRKPINSKSCFNLVNRLFESEEKAFKSGVDYLRSLYGTVEL